MGRKGKERRGRSTAKRETSELPRSTLTAKGQTTVPIEVRRHLGLEPGDQIEFILAPDGSVRLEAVTRDIRTLKGSLRSYVTAPVTVEAMKDAVRQRSRKP
jgi:AbrB family looped-hinge helix DNA binding protein